MSAILRRSSFLVFALSGLLLTISAVAQGRTGRSPEGIEPAREKAAETQIPTPTATLTEEEKKEANLPKNGVLSVTGDGGYGAVSVPGFVDPDLQGKEMPLISGSVVRSGRKEWVASVFNNSKESEYHVAIRVRQLGKGNSTIKSDSFSVSLKPGERSERRIGGSENAVGAELSLESWRKLSTKGS